MKFQFQIVNTIKVRIYASNGHIGFYVKYDGKKCLNNPIYDPNCEEFEYGVECEVCEYGHYMENNICIECKNMPENCLYCNPNDNTICEICLWGFSMTATGC